VLSQTFWRAQTGDTVGGRCCGGGGFGDGSMKRAMGGNKNRKLSVSVFQLCTASPCASPRWWRHGGKTRVSTARTHRAMSDKSTSIVAQIPPPAPTPSLGTCPITPATENKKQQSGFVFLCAIFADHAWLRAVLLHSRDWSENKIKNHASSVTVTRE